MANVQLWSNTEEYLRVGDLYDPASRTRFFVALVKVTLRTSSGAEVAGLTWPQTLTRVSGVKGAFRGVKAGGLPLLRSETYTIDVRAEAGATTARWVMKRAPSLKYVSHTTVMLRVPAVADTADVFSSVVLGLVKMTLTPFSDTADAFGAVTIGPS